MWWRTVAEGVEHGYEAGLDLGRVVTGDRKGLVHNVRPVVADRTGSELDAVADDVVLMRQDRQRVLFFERVEPALRHRERVVAEVDLAGFLVQLVHWKVGDPAELEGALLRKAELAPDLESRVACERQKSPWRAAHEKHRVTVIEPELSANGGGALVADIVGYRPGALAVTEEDVAEPGLPLVLRPRVHPVAEGAIAAPWRGNRPHPHLGVAGYHAGKHAKARAAEMLGHVVHDDRVSQIGLVARIAQQRLGIGDAPERSGAHPPAAAEFFEHPVQHRLDRGEHILLGYERHL